MNRITSPSGAFMTALWLLSTGPALAGPLTIPNTFTTGTPAVAAEVNDNFAAVDTAVNDNDARIAELETALTAVQTANADLAKLNDDLGARIAELESFLDDLRSVMSLQDDNQGNPAVVFSGVNVHVNNGLGATESINGRGNLIIGYDEPSTLSTEVCSDGEFENESECLDNGEVFGRLHKSGSHTLVVGPQHSYSQFAGFVMGFSNTVNRRFAGANGSFNIASGIGGVVSGGSQNVADGISSSVSGGRQNTASSQGSSVSGGFNNVASGGDSSISGGLANAAQSVFTSVGGGQSNVASGSFSTVSGGRARSATDDDEWVAGSLREEN